MIFIPGNVPSSKNGKIFTGKYLISSKQTMRYQRESASFYQQYAKQFRKATCELPKPLKIGFLFIRGSRHRFDYINPAQTVQDMMVKYGWIDDDNSDEIIPYFLPYRYDKAMAGVAIYIEPENDNILPT